MNKIRIISDVHGKYIGYFNRLDDCEYSICLGDLGFNYDLLYHLNHVNHRVLGGNHDNYSTLFDYPGNMGDFGEFTLNGITGFFIRGAFSIDWSWRLQHQLETGQIIYRCDE